MPNELLNRKIDFVVSLQVTNANPNGDPATGNRPRTNNAGYGIISDVCLKRKIRDRFQDNGESIFVQSDNNRVDDYPNLRTRAEATMPPKGTQEEKAESMYNRYIDVAAFGAVLAYKGKSSNDSVSIGIRGPLTVHHAITLKIPKIMPMQITKSVNGDGVGKKSSCTMATKYYVEEAIYFFKGSINAHIAKQTNLTDEYAELIKNILPRLFENDASAARPEGSMEIINIAWFDHGCPNGIKSTSKVHKSVKIDDNGLMTVKIGKGEKEVPYEIIKGY